MNPRTNYIFVDFENTQDIDLELIAGKPVKVFLILGGKQDRLSVGLVKKLLKYKAQLEVIETEQTGNHALDFVLACEIGAQAISDPTGVKSWTRPSCEESWLSSTSSAATWNSERRPTHRGRKGGFIRPVHAEETGRMNPPFLWPLGTSPGHSDDCKSSPVH